jgi:hypothetical protein
MYYKHKKLDSYIMATPARIVKTYTDSAVQYTRNDYCFNLEADINTDMYEPISQDDFRLALSNVIESLTQTLKTINNA